MKKFKSGDNKRSHKQLAKLAKRQAEKQDRRESRNARGEKY